MRLRQVALVAKDLDTQSKLVREVLGLGEPYDDPGVGEFGLRNAVFPIGDTYLEIVSPKDPGTTAERFLERRKGDGGYMAIFQVPDLEVERNRMADLGVQIVWEVNLDDAATIHLHPRDVGCGIVSLDWMNPPESWRWAGPGWESRSKTDVTAGIVGVELQSPDPQKRAERWAKVLTAEAQPAKGCYVIDLDASAVRVVPVKDNRGEGISGVDIRVNDREAILARAKERGVPCDENCVTLCGVQFYLVE